MNTPYAKRKTVCDVEIGNDSYRIITAPEPLTDDDGVRCMARIDHEQQLIWVDPEVPSSQLPTLFAHAVSRAWDDLRRRPRRLSRRQRLPGIFPPGRSFGFPAARTRSESGMNASSSAPSSTCSSSITTVARCA